MLELLHFIGLYLGKLGNITLYTYAGIDREYFDGTENILTPLGIFEVALLYNCSMDMTTMIQCISELRNDMKNYVEELGEQINQMDLKSANNKPGLPGINCKLHTLYVTVRDHRIYRFKGRKRRRRATRLKGKHRISRK